jgi:uncharacterized protein with PQ loop repeat
MIEIIGFLGMFCLIISSIPQIYKCYKEGNANGISFGSLCLVLVGFNLMLVYTSYLHPNDIILKFNYIFNMCSYLVILKYKLFPGVSVFNLLIKKLKVRIMKFL